MAINRAKVDRAAEKFVRQGRLDDAITQYRRLLSDSPDDVVTLNKIGDLYRKAGQIPRAVASFRRIADQYRERGFTQKAIAMFKKVAKLSEGDVESREALAGLYADAGLTRDALHNLREAAHLLSVAGEAERALELESRALELCPDDWKGLRSQADRLHAAGEGERAVATYLRAAAGMASCGDLDTAVDCCRSAVMSAPRDPEPVAYLVRLLVKHDRGDAAVEELNALLAENDEPHLQALLGETLLDRGDLKGAEAALRNAADSAFAAGDVGYRVTVLRLDLMEGRYPQVAESLAHIVDLMREMDDVDGTVRLLTEVHQVVPDMEIAMDLLVVSVRQNNLEPALAERALDLLAAALPPQERGDDLAFVLGRLSALRPHDEGVATRLAGSAGDTAGSSPAPAVEEQTSEFVTVEGEDGSEVDPDFVNEHLVEADVFIKYGLLAKAAAHLVKILDPYPRTLVAHQRLVEIYDETGQVEANVQQSVQLAEIHRQRGAIGEARQSLTRAYDLQPDNHSLATMLKVLSADSPLPAYQPTFANRSPQVVAPEKVAATAAPAAREVETVPPAPEKPVSTGRPAAEEPVPAPAEAAEEVLELVLDNDSVAQDPESPQAVAPPEIPEEESAAPADPVDPSSLQDTPASAPEITPEITEVPAPVASASDFFDLAEAIERELSAEGESVDEAPVVNDGNMETDTIGGIRQAIDQQVGAEDHQTHYQLGIAFKEMGLLDEAIGEFQQAANDPNTFMTCCSMLGLCFRDKGMPQIAEKWYRKGLDKGSSGVGDNEQTLGLLYDLGSLHQDQGRQEEARNCFVEVYASNASYRDVSARLKLLAGEVDATPPRAER